MDYIGIVFLAILLIYFINGLRKGFLVNLLESLKTVILFIVAFVFCKPVGASLQGVGILSKLSGDLLEYASIILGFITIYLVGTIAFGLILFIVKKLFNDPGAGSRLLGGVVGILRGLITIGLYCYVLGFVYDLIPESWFGEFINNSLNHEVGIFKFFYEHNFVEFIFNTIIKKPA